MEEAVARRFVPTRPLAGGVSMTRWRVDKGQSNLGCFAPIKSSHGPILDVAGDAQGRKRHDDLQLPDQVTAQ